MAGFIPIRCPKCGCSLMKLKEHIEGAQTEYPKAFTPWTREDDKTLKTMVEDGYDVDAISEALERQPTAITRRISKRGLGTKQIKDATPNWPGMSKAEVKWHLDQGGQLDK